MLEEVLLGGGSFWALEPALAALDGVDEVWPGYAGGKIPYPSRQIVESGITGHVEVVHVLYDPAVIDFQVLLQAFFAVHDPSLENSGQLQVPGRQYASVIYYSTREQERIAQQVIGRLKRDKTIKTSIRTEVYPMTQYRIAEPKEIGYFFFNCYRDAYCNMHVRPILRRFVRDFWPHLKIPEELRGDNPHMV